MRWYLDVLKKYAVLSGRAQRMEYWMFQLGNFVVFFLLALIEGFAGTEGVLIGLYFLGVMIPSVAETV